MAATNSTLVTKPKIAIGYQVGHLTVTNSTSMRKNGYAIWECTCVCGGIVFLDTRTLQRKTHLDCGCITNTKPGQTDLTGQRFGRLVCLAPTIQRSRDGHTVWQCRCDCGNICEAVSKQLVSGGKKSCGCLAHPPRKEYVGKQFGQLTVLDYAGKRNGMHRWKCLCSCGKTTTVGQTLLQSGKTQSCGCLKAVALCENLKLCQGTSVTMLETHRKRRLQSNTSGCTGVYQNKKTQRWIAQITFKGKTYYLGSFADFDDAVKARKEGESMHDNFLEWYYSQQHGIPNRVKVSSICQR